MVIERPDFWVWPVPPGDDGRCVFHLAEPCPWTDMSRVGKQQLEQDGL